MNLTPQQHERFMAASQCPTCQALFDILALRCFPLGGSFCQPTDYWLFLLKEYHAWLKMWDDQINVFDQFLFQRQEGLLLAFGIQSSFERQTQHPFGLLWTFQLTPEAAQSEMDYLVEKFHSENPTKMATRALWIAVNNPQFYPGLNWDLDAEARQILDTRHAANSAGMPPIREQITRDAKDPLPV